MEEFEKFKWPLPWILVAVLVVTFLAFLPSLDNGFVNWDDPVYVTTNEDIRELSRASVKKIFTSFYVGNYTPLTVLSFAVEYQWAELNPKSYHLTNIILHLLNVLLVYYCLVLLLGNRITAVMVALLFGIHPLRVESVAWVTERKDILFVFFYLSSLIAYLKYGAVQYKNRLLYYLCFILFTLSILSKQPAVSLPVVLLLIDYYRGRTWHNRILWEKSPFFLCALVFGIVAILAASLPFESHYQLAPRFSSIDRIILSVYAFAAYIGKFLIPIQLSCFYPYPEKSGQLLPVVFYGALFIPVLLVWLLLRFCRQDKLVNFGVLFFAVTIFFNLPVFGMGFTIIADRFTYLPFLGLLIILVEKTRLFYVFLRKKSKSTDSVFIILIVTVVLVLFVQTLQRCRVWQNEFTLWSDVIAKYPNVPLAYFNRVDYLVQHGQVDLAIQDYNKALELYPEYYAAYNNRGNMHLLKGNFESALADYDRAIVRNPFYADPLFNKAAYYIYRGEMEKAIECYDRILRFDPQNRRALTEKQQALEKQNP